MVYFQAMGAAGLVVGNSLFRFRLPRDRAIAAGSQPNGFLFWLREGDLSQEDEKSAGGCDLFRAQ